MLNFFFFFWLCFYNQCSKYEVVKVAIWRHFLISSKHRHTFFNICVLSFSNKKLHYNRTGQKFFNAPCKRVTSSLQKRKPHNCFNFVALCFQALTCRASQRDIIKLTILMLKYMYSMYISIFYFKNEYNNTHDNIVV